MISICKDKKKLGVKNEDWEIICLSARFFMEKVIFPEPQSLIHDGNDYLCNTKTTIHEDRNHTTPMRGGCPDQHPAHRGRHQRRRPARGTTGRVARTAQLTLLLPDGGHGSV